MNNFRSNSFGDTPPVIKNLLIINVLIFFLTFVLFKTNEKEFNEIFALHYFKSENFHWWQFVTHMFMHGGFMHIFFNMFALWMFGKVLESVWGSRRFLFYYMVTGVGAALFYSFVNYLNFSSIEASINAFTNTPSPELFTSILRKHFEIQSTDLDIIKGWVSNLNDPQFANAATERLQGYYNYVINVPTVGASGAVFGVLLGFGMLFPNTELMLIFPPIPIKAKWVVIGYGAIELYLGLTQSGGDIAHFAHLGGMLFGFILIKYWNTKRTTFY